MNNENQIYRLYLNGNLYGSGKWGYIQELMNEYVNTMNMYENEDVEFKIEKRTDTVNNQEFINIFDHVKITESDFNE